jgi:hypothetical protein
MRHRLGNSLAAAVSSLAIAGCAASTGFLRDSVTQVQVRQANFRVVKTGVAATAETGKALCLFPTDDAQVYRRLMENLHASARLGQNQMLVNIREDIQWTYYLVFYCSAEHTLSADVIEVMPGAAAGALPPAPPRPRAVPSVPPAAPAAPAGAPGRPGAVGASAVPRVPGPPATPQGPTVAPDLQKR